MNQNLQFLLLLFLKKGVRIGIGEEYLLKLMLTGLLVWLERIKHAL